MEPSRIALDNAEFEGNNNAYLLTDGEETALVDTGIATAETRRQLTRELGDRGVEFADVDVVVLTHWHGDHAGLADLVQDESGATVYAHEDDAPLIEQDPAAEEAMEERTQALFDHWGMPEAARRELNAYRERGREAFGGPASVTPLSDGDRLELAGETFRAKHAPGHTAGSICLEYGSDVLTGDALLPVYTPNVGGADTRVERPLDRYVETLRSIASAGYRRALPGHREPIPEPAGRAREILRHHEDRSRRVLSVLERAGPLDAWGVSAELFGSLEGIHVLHGPGEAYAHLDHLERNGYVERAGDEYRLATSLDGDAGPSFLDGLVD